MSFKTNAANDGLLSYGITTNPDPLQASPTKGNPSISSILVTVSNNTEKTIYCNKLTFSFTIGTSAQNLTATADGILVSANSSDNWQIVETSAGTFTATPVHPDNNEITTNGLSFQIYNIQTNDQVGTFDFDIEEVSSTDNSDFKDRHDTFSLSKFPYGFYVNNFAAASPMIGDGQQVTLTWSGSDLAAYTIYYNTTSVNVTNVRTWTSPALNNTTTFQLRAVSQVNGEVADTSLYVTVIVANPELSVTSINVAQGSTLKGATSIGSTLNVMGNTTLASAGVTGNLSAYNITAASQLTAQNIDSNGNIGVAGTAYLNNTVISGSMSVNNTVSMINGPQQIQPGTYVANTDGFVVGQVTGPDNAGSRSFGTVFGSTGNMSFSAHGGVYMGMDKYSWQLNESFTMPVSKGNSWNVGLFNTSDNKANCTGSFWWMPIGSTQSPTATFEKISDEVPEFKIPVPVQSMIEKSGSARNEIEDFITALSNAFNKTLSDDAKDTLEKHLMKLFGKDHVHAKPAPVL